MRYRCVHCDKVFERAEGEKLRCPTCMRVHGLAKEPSGGGDSSKGRLGSRRTTTLAIGALVGLLVVGAGVWHSLRQPDHDGRQVARDGTLAPAQVATLASELLARGLGVEVKPLAHVLDADDSVAEWARRVAAGQAGLAAGEAIVKALREAHDKGAYVAWSLADVRAGEAPLTPAETLAALGQAGVRKPLYPLELAALTAAALRSLGIASSVAEVFAFPDEERPLDASGRFGYYGVLLRAEPDAAPHVLDAFGARVTAPSAQDQRELTDRNVLGAALALRSAHTLASDPVRALKLADAAVELAPSSPTVRSARAIALLANAGSDQAERELRAAAELRLDASRRHNLAVLSLALGDYESAAEHLRQALSEQPQYASARVTLAGLLLGEGEAEAARKELSEAERIEPTLAALPLVWAQYYLSLGEREQALVHAERGVERQPDDPQPRILLAQLYRAAGRVDAMREQVARVLSLVPPAQRERVRAVLGDMLGPEALPGAPGLPTPASTPTAPPGELQGPSAEDVDLAAPGSLRLKPPETGRPSLLSGD